jgi:phage/plasmid-associated DNA primase
VFFCLFCSWASEQKIGLDLPASMRDDTQAYRHEQDVVGRFIDEESVVGEEFTSPKHLTYLCFKEWAEEAGEHYTNDADGIQREDAQQV